MAAKSGVSPTVFYEFETKISIERIPSVMLTKPSIVATFAAVPYSQTKEGSPVS
jgi:hypothetical protein